MEKAKEERRARIKRVEMVRAKDLSVLKGSL